MCACLRRGAVDATERSGGRDTDGQIDVVLYRAYEAQDGDGLPTRHTADTWCALAAFLCACDAPYDGVRQTAVVLFLLRATPTKTGDRGVPPGSCRVHGYVHAKKRGEFSIFCRRPCNRKHVQPGLAARGAFSHSSAHHVAPLPSLRPNVFVLPRCTSTLDVTKSMIEKSEMQDLLDRVRSVEEKAKRKGRGGGGGRGGQGNSGPTYNIEDDL